SSIRAPPGFTIDKIGMIGATVLPWKKFAALPLALRVPPLKLNVAVDPEEAADWLAVAVPTRLAVIVPPSKFTTPIVPLRMLPETSSTPQWSAPEPLTVKVPKPRLAS